MGGGVSGLFPNTYGGRNTILLAANGNALKGYLKNVKQEDLSRDKLSDRQVKNALQQAKSATFNEGSDIDKDNTLVFDGSKMNLYENGKQTQSWDGVSGNKGSQTKEFQDIKNVGPLPEGVYMLKQSNLQYFDDIGDWQKTKAFFWLGTWPRGETSWGRQRVWLTPSNETNTRGRNNFSIHGGRDPDSKGCIDLTSQMDSFAEHYKKNNKDMIVVVKYPKRQKKK